MKLFYFFSLLILFTSCGNPVANQSVLGDSMSKRDSIKKALQEDLPSPADIKQFTWFYSAFAQATVTANDSIFNVLIEKKLGLWIIYANGALPQFIHVDKISDFKDGNGKSILPFDRDPMMTVPVEEEMPQVNCDSKNFYNKKGCFTSMQNVFLEEKIWKNATLSADKDKAIEESAKTITRTVINTENYRFYFSLIDGKWFLTFLDIRKPCQA